MLPNRQTSPYILNTILTHIREAMMNQIYTQNRLLFSVFARNFQNFAADFEYRADRNRASSINHDDSAGELMVRVESPVVGGWNGAGIVPALSSTKGSFCLTDGKSARLTLMKPLGGSTSFLPAVRSPEATKEEPASKWDYAGSSINERKSFGMSFPISVPSDTLQRYIQNIDVAIGLMRQLLTDVNFAEASYFAKL